MINDVIVGGYWLVEDKIGEGAFGQVFRAKHIITKKLYALKREEKIVKNPQLLDEYRFLKLLDGHDHIPRVYWYGEKLGWNCIVMDMLGPNLRMLSKAFHTLPVAFVSHVAIQMVTVIEYVHSKGVVYRDIKPDNFLLESNFPISLDQLAVPDSFDFVDNPRYKIFQMLVGRKYKLFLVDFGLASYYIDEKTGQHIQKNKKMLKSKTGTARYASINVHKGYYHTRRDDMESLGYVFLELLKGSLPWSGIRALNSQEGWAKMLKIKKDTTLVELCKGYPMGFLRYIEYCRKLRYDERPDYDYLRSLLAGTTGTGSDAELVAQEIEWFSGKQSAFTLGRNSPLRYHKKYDYISGSGVKERSNSFTLASTNDFQSSRPRTYSLPYKDPEYVGNNIQPNDSYNNNNNNNVKDHYFRRNQNDNLNQKFANIKKPDTKGWFTPKDPKVAWDQRVVNFENAWKEGRSWNDNDDDDGDDYQSKNSNLSPTSPVPVYGASFNYDLNDDDKKSSSSHKRTYSFPCKKTIYTNNNIFTPENGPRRIYDNQPVKATFPKEFVRYPKEDKYYASHNKYPNKDNNRSPQDSRFPFGRDESDHRKRSGTYGYSSFRKN